MQPPSSFTTWLQLFLFLSISGRRCSSESPMAMNLAKAALKNGWCTSTPCTQQEERTVVQTRKPPIQTTNQGLPNYTYKLHQRTKIITGIEQADCWPCPEARSTVVRSWLGLRPLQADSRPAKFWQRNHQTNKQRNMFNREDLTPFPQCIFTTSSI